MILDAVGIQKILPHRYPFLMVDAILEIDRLKRIVGLKNVTINESHFQGHFPGAPVMPGVLIIESMAQTGGLLLLQEVPDREKKLLYFVAVDGARFRRPVVPGDQLRVEMNVLSWRGDFCKVEGKATVNGQLAAEATLMCKMVDREVVANADFSALATTSRSTILHISVASAANCPFTVALPSSLQKSPRHESTFISTLNWSPGTTGRRNRAPSTATK